MSAKHGQAVPVRLRSSDGTTLPLSVGRWCDRPDAVDLGVLDRAAPPILDVGCGPGRFALAAAERGWPALGIDTAPTAVQLGRVRGAAILQRSIFDPIPGAGRWATALLLDGSLGIGGRPVRLLARVRSLLRREARLLVEVEPPPVGVRPLRVRMEAESVLGPWFEWARVGADGIGRVAERAGLRFDELWEEGGRWFAALAT